jgi:LysM repeat protein
MAAIEPGIRRHDLEGFLRRSSRLGALAAYVTALAVGLVAVRPAFEHQPALPVVKPPPAPPQVDSIRKGESVATFAARHGLDLGQILALNPKIDSLTLPKGTKLRIG